MIRRILHELNVRTLASDVRRRAVNAFHRNVYVYIQRTDGCAILGPRPRSVALAYVVDGNPAPYLPSGAALLTIGRVTLAAWGGRSS